MYKTSIVADEFLEKAVTVDSKIALFHWVEFFDIFLKKRYPALNRLEIVELSHSLA
jgi:hypothetical protein